MKRMAALAVVSMAAVCAVAPLGARADTDVYVGVNFNSTQDFYQPLQPHGTWIQTANYGQCWRPAYVEADWRPYTNGAWVWTDYGWYWTTTEPWGWATYHYGRWVWDSYYGWVWVPGLEWAPSWVCWREGGGYIGWAPMPPQCTWGNGGYFMYQEAWVSPSWFVFVGVGNFCRPITPRHCVPHHNIIHQTVNCTRIKQINNIVINNGPSVDFMRRANPDRLREFNPRPVITGGVADVERRVPPAMQESRQKQDRGHGYAGGAGRTVATVPQGSKRNVPDLGGITAPIKTKEIRPDNRPTQRPIVIRSQPERREDQNLRQPAEYPVFPPRSQMQKRQQPQPQPQKLQPTSQRSVPTAPQQQSEQQTNSDGEHSRGRNR